MRGPTTDAGKKATYFAWASTGAKLPTAEMVSRENAQKVKMMRQVCVQKAQGKRKEML
jgi:hypothetical protein